MTSLLLRRTTLAALVGLSCVGVAACTQAPVQSAASTPTLSASTDTPTDTASQSPTPTDAATGFGTMTTTATPSRTPSHTASVSALPSTTASAASGDPNACKASSLTVTVERGSGTNGHQYATLRFTNAGATKCDLAGFPEVRLLLDGAAIGTAAEHSNAQPTTVVVLPGRSAIAALTNDSTCNALNSNEVGVTPPNTTAETVKPLTFRACTLTVDPVSRG